MQNPSFKQLLSQPKFRNLWASQIFSQLTINLVNFFLLIRIYSLTKSAVAVSLLWLAYSLPAFLFGPFSGSLVDRFSRRHIMILANVLQAVTVFSYLFAGQRLFILYSLAFLYSAFDQLYIPAQQATIPGLVHKNLLPLANGIFMLTQQTSFLIGFGLGGLLLSLAGRDLSIILASLFLLVAAYFAFRLPKEPKKDKSLTDTSFENFMTDVAEGYKLLKSSPAIKFPVALIIFLQIFITILSIIFPSFTSESLGLSLYHAGTILVIPGVLGALAATYALPKTLRIVRKKQIIEYGLLTAALSLVAMNLSAVLPSFLRILFSLISAVGLGISIASALVPANTMLQEQTPTEYRGRVYGVLGFFMTISTAIPLMAISSLADLFGTQIIMALMALTLFSGYLFIKISGDTVLRGKTLI